MAGHKGWGRGMHRSRETGTGWVVCDVNRGEQGWRGWRRGCGCRTLQQASAREQAGWCATSTGVDGWRCGCGCWPLQQTSARAIKGGVGQSTAAALAPASRRVGGSSGLPSLFEKQQPWDQKRVKLERKQRGCARRCACALASHPSVRRAGASRCCGGTGEGGRGSGLQNRGRDRRDTDT